jgi:hypothetical protein
MSSDQTPETNSAVKSQAMNAESKADKKKIKILKQALKEERDQRGTVEQDLKNSSLKIEQLN